MLVLPTVGALACLTLQAQSFTPLLQPAQTQHTAFQPVSRVSPKNQMKRYGKNRLVMKNQLRSEPLLFGENEEAKVGNAQFLSVLAGKAVSDEVKELAPVKCVLTNNLPSESTSPTSTSPTLRNASETKARDLMESRRHNVSPAVAQMLYEDMLLGRIFEDMIAQLYYRGRVAGFVHLYNGQEAVATGLIKALRPDDHVVSTYRDHVHALSKGVPPGQVMAELQGKETGCSKGRGGSMHMFSKPHNFVGGFAFIGENIPVALGIAYSIAYRRNALGDKSADQVVLCFQGDGASNSGQFYEALNLAALARLPIIFVVENNNWAIGMASYRSTSVPEIYKKAEAFGLPGVEVDGMDVLQVRSVAREAIDRARSGGGPTLVEALTYRFRGHSLADPDELRASGEKSAWLQRDPLESFEKYMKGMGYANDYLLKTAQKKVRAAVDAAVKFSDDSPDPKVEEISKYIFSDHYVPTPENLSDSQLNEYAKALGAELEQKNRLKKGDKTPAIPVQMETSPLKVII
eukprot:GHVN01001417.1.p3 GENE.GHVN01001417.1~~GHVN01001417.1.p3  ORF type:complete len:518 (-),score=60.80 GHVN01001417.1:129-1682(-)